MSTAVVSEHTNGFPKLGKLPFVFGPSNVASYPNHIQIISKSYPNPNPNLPMLHAHACCSHLKWIGLTLKPFFSNTHACDTARNLSGRFGYGIWI